MSQPKLSQADKEKLKKAFDFSHFDINAILRGMQLTLVGGEEVHDTRHETPNFWGEEAFHFGSVASDSLHSR